MPYSKAQKPLIKYPGGKEKELKIILEYIPKQIENYYEPFVGGGAVYFGGNLGKRKYINDASKDLISFYKCIKKQDVDLFMSLTEWDNRLHEASITAESMMDRLTEAYLKDEKPNTENAIINEMLEQKFARIRKKAAKENELKKLEPQIIAVFKQKVYQDARDVYNNHRNYDGVRAAAFVMMRMYGFSGMFRFNSTGEFNIPYGGIAYNQKYLNERIDRMQSEPIRKMFNKTKIECHDFLEFMRKNIPGENDFVFIDPPYDGTFSTYDQNEFNQTDQERLANYLINECAANWMVVIKATDFIRHLYRKDKRCLNGKTIHIAEFDKKYDVCIRGRNDKTAEHMIITNYISSEE